MQAAGLLALIALSPVLMVGSAWVAMRLDALRTLAAMWVASPFVLAGAALCVLTAVATKWARVW